MYIYTWYVTCDTLCVPRKPSMINQFAQYVPDTSQFCKVPGVKIQDLKKTGPRLPLPTFFIKT